MMIAVASPEKIRRSPFWRNVQFVAYFLFVSIPMILYLAIGGNLLDRYFPILTDVEIVMRDRERTDALVFRFALNKQLDCDIQDLTWYGVSKGGALAFATFTSAVNPSPTTAYAPPALATRPPGLGVSGAYTVYLPDTTVPKFEGVIRYRCPYFGSRVVILGPWDNWLAPTSPTQAIAPLRD